jgi:hypothetical protein
MGLRSPQETQLTRLRPQGATRFQGAQAATIDPSFIGTLQKTVDAKEVARRKAEKENLKFIRTQYQNENDNARIEAQALVSNTTGIESFDAEKNQRDRLLKTAEKSLAKYPEKYHPYLRQDLEKSITKFNSAAVPHVYGQMRKVQDEAYKTNTLNRINDTIEGSADLDLMEKEGLPAVAAAAEQVALRVYGENPSIPVAEGVTAGDMITSAKQAAVSEAIRRSVEQQARVDGERGIERAEEILTKFNPNMTPQDRVKAAKILDSAKKDQGTKEASGLATEARRRFTDSPVAQEEFIRANSKNDRQLREANAILTLQNNAEKEERKQKIDSALAKLNADLSVGKPLDMATYLSIPAGEERDKFTDALNKNRGYANIITDQNVWNDVNNKLRDATSFKEIEKMDLNTYRHQISSKDMAPLEAQFNRLKRAETDAIAKAQLGLGRSYIDDVAFKIAKDQGLVGKKNLINFQIKAYELSEQLIKQNPKATQKEIKDKLYLQLRDEGIVKVKDESTGIFGFFQKEKTVVNPELIGPAADPSWYKMFKTLRPGYSDSQINELIKRAKDKGMKIDQPVQ